MHDFMLQDWVTVGAASAVTSFAQEDGGWLDLEAYQDVIFFLDVRELTAGGGTLSVVYETSPIWDNAYFVQMTTQSVTIGTWMSAVRLNDSGGVIPVARWVRWRIAVTGATQSWDTTFRIWVAANAPGA